LLRPQLLVNNSDSCRVWTRWGRVGERGLNATLGNGSLADGIKNFEKKFRDKSGLSWENRLGQGKAGKYTFIERSYDDSDDEGDNDNDDGDVNEEDDNDGWTPPESKLEPEVQDLIAMIFNTKFMQAAFEDLNYDAKKLPLGK
jgi:poly [ADP-ribose] polymerase